MAYLICTPNNLKPGNLFFSPGKGWDLSGAARRFDSIQEAESIAPREKWSIVDDVHYSVHRRSLCQPSGEYAWASPPEEKLEPVAIGDLVYDQDGLPGTVSGLTRGGKVFVKSHHSGSVALISRSSICTKRDRDALPFGMGRAS